MTGKTHMLGGLTAAATLLTVAPAEPVMAAAVGVAAVVGSLLPDIDKRGSKISNRVGLLGGVVRLFFSHRGLLHDPTLYLALYGLLALMGLSSPWFLLVTSLFAGIFSHLLLDGLTSMGVPILLLDVVRVPLAGGRLKRRRYRLLKLRTGGVGEWITAALLLAASLYLLWGFVIR